MIFRETIYWIYNDNIWDVRIILHNRSSAKVVDEEENHNKKDKAVEKKNIKPKIVYRITSIIFILQDCIAVEWNAVLKKLVENSWPLWPEEIDVVVIVVYQR